MTDKNQNDELDPTPDLDDAELEGASGGTNTDYSYCKGQNGPGEYCGRRSASDALYDRYDSPCTIITTGGLPNHAQLPSI